MNDNVQNQNNQPRQNQRNPLIILLVVLALIVVGASVIYTASSPVDTGTVANDDDRTGDKADSEASAKDSDPQNGFAGRNNALGIPATPTPAATPTAKVYTEAEVQATVEAAKAAAVEQRENELLVPSSAQPEPTPTIRVERVTVESNSGNNQATVESVTTSTVPAGGCWDVTFYNGATHQMRGQEGPLGPPWAAFPCLAPAKAPVFPDVAIPALGLPAEWGLMYEEDETQHCGAIDDQCSIVIAPGHYALVTGSAEHQFGGCVGGGNAGHGCAQVFVNVGLAEFELVGRFNNVFTVQGRYHDGDHLPEAVNALMSHASWNMVDGPSTLNPMRAANAGGNCGNIDGCIAVLNQFFVTSGGELLIHGAAFYNR